MLSGISIRYNRIRNEKYEIQNNCLWHRRVLSLRTFCRPNSRPLKKKNLQTLVVARWRQAVVHLSTLYS
jgi:hypothetical protein